MDHKVLHCNRCLLHKTDASDQGFLFYIANCRHVFCASCRQASPGCFICNDPKTQLIPINERMNGNTRLVMTNPGSLLGAMEKSLAFHQMQTSFFNQAAEQKMTAMQKELQKMANEAMEIHKMATETNQEADYLEAENFKLETELKKLERDIKGMRSAINTNFVLPRRSPTVTRISPALSGSLPPSGRRSFDFMQNFGAGSRHTPSPNLLSSREMVQRATSRASSAGGNMPNIFEKSLTMFKTPNCSPAKLYRSTHHH